MQAGRLSKGGVFRFGAFTGIRTAGARTFDKDEGAALQSKTPLGRRGCGLLAAT